MKTVQLVSLFGLCCSSLLLSSLSFSQSPYQLTYSENCAVCHGESLEGGAQGVPLMGELQHGDSIDALIQSISNGYSSKGMPSWQESLDQTKIKSLALYIAESRVNLNYNDFNVDTPLEIPHGIQQTELHNFKFETIIIGLDPLPYSIAPLPDGRILLTEKKRGLSVIDNGKQSAYINNAPKAYDDTQPFGPKLEQGNGWLLDVALHPNYRENGWIYISFGDRCSDCNAISKTAKIPVAMNKLVRGRIKDGRWVDQQIIWQSDKQHYVPGTDMAAGGRIAFDNKGHVFTSAGMKGIDNHTGVQDLSKPWGKIHRLNDDGSIPNDNPFTTTEGAIKSIWTYGHRSPHGLEVNPQTDELWSTEMGPRGGDELNRLLAGKNYGWPLYSKGLNYDGTPVDYGKVLGLNFNLKDIEQPVVDMTPSPAVSSFIFYSGEQFPQWTNNLLVGSLKARSLYRMVLDNNQVIHRETIVKDLTRIRDIEQGPNGEIYLLLEHKSGGQIVRLTPEA